MLLIFCSILLQQPKIYLFRLKYCVVMKCVNEIYIYIQNAWFIIIVLNCLDKLIKSFCFALASLYAFTY